MRTQLGFRKCPWPYDPESAKTIECFTAPVLGKRVYIWKPFDQSVWNYTIKGDHTGSMETTSVYTAFAKAEDKVRFYFR